MQEAWTLVILPPNLDEVRILILEIEQKFFDGNVKHQRDPFLSLGLVPDIFRKFPGSDDPLGWSADNFASQSFATRGTRYCPRVSLVTATTVKRQIAPGK
jgi:hypothetical protein